MKSHLIGTSSEELFWAWYRCFFFFLRGETGETHGLLSKKLEEGQEHSNALEVPWFGMQPAAAFPTRLRHGAKGWDWAALLERSSG